MSSCVSTTKNKIIVVEERKRKAIFINSGGDEFKKGKIDGCLVTEGIRADYFVSGLGRTILVELKGSDVGHACSQLFAAADHENVKKYLEPNIGFLIICSRYPAHSTSVQLA